MGKTLDVKKLRTRLNLSQAAFARLLRVDQSTVQRIEAGKRPPSGPVQVLLEQIAVQWGDA